jgi:hypothetical protein
MRLHVLAFVVAPLLAGAVARAGEEDKRACMKAYVDAQSLRADEKLRAAHDAANVCARAVCPALLRNDCVVWAQDLERMTPTVVFSAVDGHGNDRADARVTVDGSIGARLDGAATTLDPGEHVVRCELAGETPIEMRVVLHESEHERPVRCEFPTHPASGATAPAIPSAPPAAPMTAVPPLLVRPVPASVYVLGGVGAVALGGWAWFGGSALIWGNPSVRTLHGCQPGCQPSDRDTVHTELVAADVAGGIALLALGATAYLYFTRSTVIVPTSGGLLATWRTSF